jgi:ferrous iron transport protein B
MHLLLVGNPNCGKTTLFNALTGDNQRVGNWPGVTVEQKKGVFTLGDQSAELIDLPGIYSLTAQGEGLSQDEQIANQAIATLDVDCIINVIDACHLERHLYLTTQLLELGKPLIVVLTMVDIADNRKISIDTNKLEAFLGCPVIPVQAHKAIGLSAIQQTLLKPLMPAFPLDLNCSEEINHLLEAIELRLTVEGIYTNQQAYYHARRLAEGDLDQVNHLVSGNGGTFTQEVFDLDVALADARYQKIHEMVLVAQKKQSDASEHFTAKLDKIVLNRFAAIPLFLAMMYLMFLFAINIGGAFQDFFDISTDTVFVRGSAWLLQQVNAPNWFIALIANGMGKGINTTLTFVPVIAAMFFFLSLLETSGYMARAAFVVDKAMRAMGLPGKAFVPMIVGFGCNVPAIMAARTLDSERDRLLTVMMSPFMSCSARLAIYSVFVAAFFPSGGQNVVFSLYLMGILMAILTGFILRKTHLKGHASPLILELPAYHKPSIKRLLKETGIRLRHFLFRAGRLIIPICVLLGSLNAITVGGALSGGEANASSLLSLIGQWITPLFAPMGIHQDNWPATVGLLTGMLAKEVVVGTLNTLYAQAGNLNVMVNAPFDLLAGLSAAVWSIPNNLLELGSVLANPIAAGAADNTVSSSVYGVMVQRFDGWIGAYAYLLFVLLYVPCVSTMAVIKQEANSFLMWVSVSWSFLLAYLAAVLFYQTANFFVHVEHSGLWLFTGLGIFLVAAVVFYCRNLTNMRKCRVVADT